MDRYSTFLRRAIALFIDIMIILIISELIESVLIDIREGAVFLYVNTFLFPYLYFMIFHLVNGQTIGKMITKIKIYDIDEINKNNVKQAIFRDLIPFSVSLIMLLLLLFVNNEGLGYLMFLLVKVVLFCWIGIDLYSLTKDNKRRSIQDKISKTTILRI